MSKHAVSKQMAKQRMTVLFLLASVCITPALAKPDLFFEQTDDSIALKNGKKTVWQYNHKVSEGKPYFHPLSNIDGDVLTWLRPADHVWHRSMWHSWKYINGLNYWEENRKTGKSQGVTEIKKIKIKKKRKNAAEIELTLSYHPPEKPEIMSEERSIYISSIDKPGNYYIDWTSTFTATGTDVKLDRTPLQGEPRGKSWGGYAGLSIRMAKNTQRWNFVNSEDEANMTLHGKPAKWVNTTGKTSSGKEAALTILDHPSNMRHPSPWYIAKDMPYFSPAIIFNEPFTLKKGESFKLKYRVLVHSNPLNKEQIEKEWKKFSK